MHKAITCNRSKAAVARVVGAEHISMRQHAAGTIWKCPGRGICQQLHVGGACEPCSNQKIPITLHEIRRYAALAQTCQGMGYVVAHGRGNVITYPVLKKYRPAVLIYHRRLVDCTRDEIHASVAASIRTDAYPK